MIKENMMQEKKWNEERTKLLVNQIEFLKSEILVKNTFIESLIVELSKKGTTSNRDCSSTSFENTINDSRADVITPSICSDINIFKIDEYKLESSPGKSDHSKVTPIKSNSSEPRNITSSSRHRTLIVDESSDFDEVYKNSVKCKHINRRLSVVINEKPESDFKKFHDLKHVPGNSPYTDVTRIGKKILILSDSKCSRIKMKELNYYIENGYAYRKTFPGATANELAHYCIPTLLEDKSETVIINIGTNSRRKKNPSDICNEITNIVSTCHSYGVKDVYVSAVIFRPNFDQLVNETNNFLRAKQLSHGFVFIDNDNILNDHIWKEKIHLNNKGTVILANNFIKYINRKHTDWHASSLGSSSLSSVSLANIEGSCEDDPLRTLKGHVKMIPCEHWRVMWRWSLANIEGSCEDDHLRTLKGHVKMIPCEHWRVMWRWSLANIEGSCEDDPLRTLKGHVKMIPCEHWRVMWRWSLANIEGSCEDDPLRTLKGHVKMIPCEHWRVMWRWSLANIEGSCEDDPLRTLKGHVKMIPCEHWRVMWRWSLANIEGSCEDDPLRTLKGHVKMIPCEHWRVMWRWSLANIEGSCEDDPFRTLKGHMKRVPC